MPAPGSSVRLDNGDMATWRRWRRWRAIVSALHPETSLRSRSMVNQSWGGSLGSGKTTARLPASFPVPFRRTVRAP